MKIFEITKLNEGPTEVHPNSIQGWKRSDILSQNNKLSNQAKSTPEKGSRAASGLAAAFQAQAKAAGFKIPKSLLAAVLMAFAPTKMGDGELQPDTIEKLINQFKDDGKLEKADFTEAGDLRSTIDAYKQSFIKKTPPESWLPDEKYREQLDNAIKKYGNNAKKLVAYIRSDNDFMLWFAKLPERDYLKKDAMAIIRPTVSETATAGSTSSGNMATVANPISANAKIKRDKNGVPMAPQKKNADGTAKNALELGNNLMGGATVKR